MHNYVSLSSNHKDLFLYSSRWFCNQPVNVSAAQHDHITIRWCSVFFFSPFLAGELSLMTCWDVQTSIPSKSMLDTQFLDTQLVHTKHRNQWTSENVVDCCESAKCQLVIVAKVPTGQQNNALDYATKKISPDGLIIRVMFCPVSFGFFFLGVNCCFFFS